MDPQSIFCLLYHIVYSYIVHIYMCLLKLLSEVLAKSFFFFFGKSVLMSLFVKQLACVKKYQ